jgi:D-inositol-3-phosphate glycosyltransferase
MRIGVLAHNYPPHPGGLEVMVENVSTRLAAHHEVVLVTSAWNGARGLDPSGALRVHRLPAVHHTERWGVPYPVPWGPGLIAAVKDLRTCDVLHAHGALYTGSMFAAVLSRIGPRPLVLTEHVGMVPYSSALLMGVQRAAWVLAGDAVVAASSGVVTYNARVRNWMRDRFRDRQIEFIGNGVDSSVFRPLSPQERLEARRSFGLPPDEVLVLYAGRATPKKNFPVVEAISRSGFQLVVCGADRRLQAPGLIDLGVVPHARMPELYGAVDLFVLPSVGEGFPLSLQEAMASGCPPVVLWDDGYAESLDRDQVTSCDTLDQIAAAVLGLVTEARAREQRGRQAREWAKQKWSWEVTVSEYERLFQRVLVR